MIPWPKPARTTRSSSRRLRSIPTVVRSSTPMVRCCRTTATRSRVFTAQVTRLLAGRQCLLGRWYDPRQCPRVGLCRGQARQCVRWSLRSSFDNAEPGEHAFPGSVHLDRLNRLVTPMPLPLSQLVYSRFHESTSTRRVITLHRYNQFLEATKDLGLAVNPEGVVLGLQASKGVYLGRGVVGYTWFVGPLDQPSPVRFFGDAMQEIERFLWDEVIGSHPPTRHCPFSSATNKGPSWPSRWRAQPPTSSPASSRLMPRSRSFQAGIRHWFR